ncbi:Cytosolic seryl-tRNA synthetase [Orbilia brochopaga]|uniref:serine--tRNA ligase n=1 Tax=Orbilia brochopaga TaxID=3140254 RepID=A0AAV9UW37_9PEZI
MLDIISFVTERGGDPEAIRESQRRRHKPVEDVDAVIELYHVSREANYLVARQGTKINEIQKEIKTLRGDKEKMAPLLEKKAELEKEKKDLEAKAKDVEADLLRKLRTIGNIVHDSVPMSDNEDNNAILRDWKPSPDYAVERKDDILSHHEVLTRLDGYDPDRGAKIVGHRGYFLKTWGLFLNQALINYGLEFLLNKGYTPISTPQFMDKKYMAKTAQLEQFDEELYKVVDGDDEKYLIATSEQPISALHADEWLTSVDVPKRYAGFSSCYRREAGSHGKDAWGIFRVHQFEKVEQFVICDPEKSWEMFDQMIEYSEEFYQSLKLPYRVVAIVSGALNNAAAKKYDLEAWFPFQGEYKELVSCSNCTDYQSRSLEIRYGAKTQTDTVKKYVHCLNSTLTATERTMCCILENYQTPEGFNVPEVLRKYLPGNPEFLPFTKELPKDTTSVKKKNQQLKVVGKGKAPENK